MIGFFDKNEVMEESVKMKQFNHLNVMNLIGVCINAGPAPYIVMPFKANGSLLSYLRRERPKLLLEETADEDLVRPISLRGIFRRGITFPSLWGNSTSASYCSVLYT